MLCFRYKKLLIPYVECSLDERRRARLEAHISRCASCSAELALIRSVSVALREATTPPSEPAHDLWAKVSARIESEAPAPSPRTWLRTPQLAGAGVALMAVIGLGMMNVHQPLTAPSSKQGTTPVAQAPKHAEPNRVAARAPAVSHDSWVYHSSAPTVTPKERAARPRPTPSISTRPAPPPAETGAKSTEVAATHNRSHGGAWFDDTPKRAVAAASVEPAAPVVAKRVAPASADACYYTGDRVAGGSAEATKSEMSAGYGLYETSEAVRADAAPVLADAAEVGRVGVTINSDWQDESVVDELNKTEGVRMVAVFSYP